LEKIKPKKSLGQNFLVDKNFAKKIVDALETDGEDIIVEIGPGTGSLTDFLAVRNCNLVLVEIDPRAIEILKKKYSHLPKIKFINDDFTKINLLKILAGFHNLSYNEKSLNPNLFEKKIKIIGNIPYYLTSQVFFKIFDNSDIIESSILTIQKEVAQRITATAGCKEYGILSVATKINAEARILFDIPPSCFYPPPKVISSVIELKIQRKFSKFEFDEIMILIRTAFNQRRKIIKNSIRDYISQRVGDEKKTEKIIQKIDYYLHRRPEELSYIDFKELYESINKQ